MFLKIMNVRESENKRSWTFNVAGEFNIFYIKKILVQEIKKPNDFENFSLEINKDMIERYNTWNKILSIKKLHICKSDVDLDKNIESEDVDIFVNKNGNRSSLVDKQDEVLDNDLISEFDYIDYEKIYIQEKNNYKFSDTNNNRKLQDLINQTLTQNRNASYTRAVTKARGFDLSIMSFFDSGMTENFIFNKTAKLKLTKPKSLRSDIKPLNPLDKIQVYESFVSKKDINAFIEEDIEWEEFATIVNREIQKRYKKINAIARNALDNQNETGNWSFFLAWPFIEGQTTKRKIRVPLMYTPMSITVNNGEYTIKRLDSKIKINNQFIRTYYFEQSKSPLNLKVYFDTFQDILREYKKHGISFSNQLGELERFKTIKKDDFVTKNPSAFEEWELKNTFIFENVLFSDDVFEDSLRIIKNNNDFLTPKPNKSIIDVEEIKDYNDLLLDVDKDKNNIINEALEDSLTIWGPPGTGKSETIASFLAQSMANKKTNLVVSEKDAALSVLVSRLNKKYDLDSFVLKLNGNNLKKNIFWEKIKNVISLIRKPMIEKDINDIENFHNFLKSFYEFNKSLLDIKVNESEQKEELFFKYQEIIYEFEKNINTEIVDFKETFQIKLDELNNYNDNVLKLESLINNKSNLEREKKEIEIQYNEAKENVLSRLIPPISYLPKSLINFEDLEEIGKSSLKEFFKKISNKHYGLFRINKEYKNNQMAIANLFDNLILLNEISIVYKNKDIDKKIINIEDEIKNINNNINLFCSSLHNDYSVEKYKLLMEKIQKEIDNINIIYSKSLKFYKKEFLDADAKVKSLSKLRSQSIQNSKHNLKARIIEIIRDKIDENPEIETIIGKLSTVTGFSTRKKQKNPGTIIRGYFEAIQVLFPVIIATPNEVSRYLPNNGQVFNYGIFDEASQMELARALPSLHRVEKAIISGDEKQLAPSSWFTSNSLGDVSETDLNDIDLEADSLLNFAKGKYKIRLLANHYRSKNSKLIEYSNMTFYEGRLKSINSPIANTNPIEVYNSNGIWEENVNDKEAADIVAYLEKNLNRFGNSIGVITMNIQQRDLISTKIYGSNSLVDCFEKGQIFVKNIENVQGDEADLIIFSLAYSTNNGNRKIYVPNSLTKNRLNVAITRAKEKMVCFRSFESNELGPGSENTPKNTLYSWVKWLEDNCINDEYSFTDSIRNHVPKFRSPFEEEFYELASEMLPSNIKLLANYNISGYEIDLVLYDFDQSKFIGAIELDGITYHSSLEQLRRDEIKTDFLRNVGWDLTRLFSTEFWNNKEACVKKILSKYIKINH